jgi:hypothetical protein
VDGNVTILYGNVFAPGSDGYFVAEILCRHRADLSSAVADAGEQIGERRGELNGAESRRTRPSCSYRLTATCGPSCSRWSRQTLTVAWERMRDWVNADGLPTRGALGDVDM